MASSSATLPLSSSSSSSSSLEDLYTRQEFYLGLCLAISSSIFIGSSFIIKKLALIRINRVGEVRAGAGGFGYLKEWIWWAGLLTMGIGEVANFAAYAYAPASLVTPLGALSVIVSAIMASKYLKERLNLLGKLGCLLCIIGSTIIVIHAPKEKEVENLNALYEKLQDPGFILYVIILLGSTIFVSLLIAPRYGTVNVTVYIFLCSTIGSLTVLSCKALGLAIRDTASGISNDFGTWTPWILIIISIIFIAIQMNYLNKALDIFNTSIVTPVYYVIFTTFVITGSAILFKEWKHMTTENILGDFCGFTIVIIAVFMLNAFKDLDISLSDLGNIVRPRQQRVLSSSQCQHGIACDAALISRYGSRDKVFNAGYGTNDISRNV